MMYRSCSRCGKVHSASYKCYKGMTNHANHDKLRSTSRWQKKREEVREAAAYLCEVCRDEGVYNNKGIEVHHITKLRDRPDLLLDNENLICLCRQHHELADEGKLDRDYLISLAQEREADFSV